MALHDPVDLNKHPEDKVGQILYMGLVCFVVYFSMYMMRKPFTAATFDQVKLWNWDYKILLVVAQVLGYATSKFLGIKIIAELKPEKRLTLLRNLLLFATFSLIGFAMSPYEWGPFWLFLNGLPLGLVWGIVFSYCEGRRITEVLTVILSANFIFSSGVAKSLGRSLLAYDIPEQIMPAIIAVCSLPIFFISAYFLKRLPPPSLKDMETKSVRLPMSGTDRKNFLLKYLTPILLFSFVYLLLTVLRDVRDNFMVEIMVDMGIGNSSVFAMTELAVTLIILFELGFIYLIHENHKALIINLVICLAAVLIILGASILLTAEKLSPLIWMVFTGIGLFLPYIILNGIAYDRFIATYRIKGNVGFIMYITDAIGYLASVSVLIVKNFFDPNLHWFDFYKNMTFIVGGATAVALVFLLGYFVSKKTIPV